MKKNVLFVLSAITLVLVSVAVCALFLLDNNFNPFTEDVIKTATERQGGSLLYMGNEGEEIASPSVPGGIFINAEKTIDVDEYSLLREKISKAVKVLLP